MLKVDMNIGVDYFLDLASVVPVGTTLFLNMREGLGGFAESVFAICYRILAKSCSKCILCY